LTLFHDANWVNKQEWPNMTTDLDFASMMEKAQKEVRENAKYEREMEKLEQDNESKIANEKGRRKKKERDKEHSITRYI